MRARRLQHEHNPGVQVRVVGRCGTAKAAIHQRFSQTVLTLASKQIELARQLRQVSELWDVPDLVLGGRIGWTKSKVSKHLTAAEGERQEPRFAALP